MLPGRFGKEKAGGCAWRIAGFALPLPATDGTHPHMAGIYIHIPFCKTRCAYCDFYSTTRTGLAGRYVRALCRELRERRDYLKGEAVRTVYFGGGTPSLLREEDFARVFEAIAEAYGTDAARETTLEANPDDLTDDYADMLCRRLPFNRISLGVQTFDDATLRLLNRRHNARQAAEAVARCRRAGFANIGIDLIYGLPGETDRRWQDDLKQAVELGVEHISAYHLTYEEGTPLHGMLRAGRIRPVDEEASLRFYTMLTGTLSGAGYVHYEISSFCKPGFHSRHNTAYWQAVPYLGCGAAAHSFDGGSREWNAASLRLYLEGMESGRRPHESERLDTATRYNERVMTSLRTMWGLSLERLRTDFGEGLHRHCLSMAAPFLADGRLRLSGDRLCLTSRSVFVSDGIISTLMYTDD